jgi:hypothetical protein
MRVYKFVKLNPFGSTADVLPNDPQYAKLNAFVLPNVMKLFVI